jgi:hypothetical protein
MNSFSAIIVAILGFPALVFQAPSATVEYFPVGVLALPPPPEHKDPKLNDMRLELERRHRSWISKDLREMDEPSLWEDSQKQGQEIYRFIWVRSFHQPVAVRLSINPDGSGDLVAKVLSGMGGYNSGSLIMNQQSHVSAVEVSSFIEKLSNANFWHLSTIRIEYIDDGAEWIMEATKNGTYHIIQRTSPRTGAFRDACMFLAIALAKLKIPDREIY